MLQMKSKLSFGSLNLYLKSYRPSPTTSVPLNRLPRRSRRLALAREADLSAVRTIPVARRPNKVSAEEFAHPPGDDRSFGAFLECAARRSRRARLPRGRRRDRRRRDQTTRGRRHARRTRREDRASRRCSST